MILTVKFSLITFSLYFAFVVEGLLAGMKNILGHLFYKFFDIFSVFQKDIKYFTAYNTEKSWADNFVHIIEWSTTAPIDFCA